MATRGEMSYIPLEALAQDNNNDAEEEQLHRKRRNLWHRIDTASVWASFLGFPLLLLAVTLLALFWYESLKAIDGAEPQIYWVCVVNAGWVTRLVTVCTTSIRMVMAFQAGLATAMVAGIVLETKSVSLLQSPFYSILWAVKIAFSNLWTSTNFRPHLSRFIYVLVLTEVLVITASQFLSTIFLSDFVNGSFTQCVLSPGNTSSTNNNWGILTLDPRSQWETFHPPADTLGVDDTITFFLAVLPNLLTLCVNYNYTADSGVSLSRKIANFGNAHTTHIDLFQDTLITTASPALAVQALLTRIY
ncbi:uncharacterized protein TRUGW13939_00361 [Talaromyces rugulosus]|uniref:Transmembrane protein n=1 Tax=Talaromyces rugulosus TaxID=121627 RepID=A0A7H8QJB3_TALRU|nr:uncharacterized protein TRUGW13939_00361 [Talaromyces rugulosus]QKX53283.1 hypothetical protein TRUGW13939_00361 [Talaromyces rugulosus]